MTHPEILWQPDHAQKEGSNLAHYMRWLSTRRNLTFSSYDQLWQWSTENIREFWSSIWEYFQVKSYSPYQHILSPDPMPHCRWFEGATLNYAEHVFRNSTTAYPALLYQSENHPLTATTWAELEQKVASFSGFLKASGVGKGDCVVAYLPTIPEATIAFLATCSIGAVWSSCSPDFGVASVTDRFQQIEPKVLIAVNRYQYGGKRFDKTKTVEQIIGQLPTLNKVVIVSGSEDSGEEEKISGKAIPWDSTMTYSIPLIFEPVSFNHPIWVLYSSGTTGKPKAITHSQGGALLEHLKYISFHNNVKKGERYFWYTTTGWMMWNFVQATLLCGATIILYDGSPGYPDLNILWSLAEEAKINHFGTSAPFITACKNAELQPNKKFQLASIQSISSTGAPLSPAGFRWIYESVKKQVWLCSMSGGTDVCSAFVGGCPLEPVYEGEIQRRALGCAMAAYNEEGQKVVDEVGEMVIEKPMPSMPVYFWNDPDKVSYYDSYFSYYPGIWRHGDWLKITPRNTLIILGRSDATLNRLGIRIGTAEIYRSVEKVREVKDSLIVNLELSESRHYMPLFVLMNEGFRLTEEIKKKITDQLKSDYTSRHIPDDIIEADDLPYTISGKKMEAPVKKLLMGFPLEKAANKGAMRNPHSLSFFQSFAKNIQR